MSGIEEYITELEEEGESRPHQNLDVWKRSLSFVKKVYELTNDFPENEEYGLSSQIRRAASSVPSNIAEGAARNTENEFLNFLHMAQGSNSEIETQLLIASQLGFVEEDELKKLLKTNGEISRMIVGLQNSLRR